MEIVGRLELLGFKSEDEGPYWHDMRNPEKRYRVDVFDDSVVIYDMEGNCHPDWRQHPQDIEKFLTTLEAADVINKPRHYHVTIKGVELDCFDVMDAVGVDTNHFLASAFAYLFRCMKKGNTLLDVKKAIFYLNKWVERYERNEKQK